MKYLFLAVSLCLVLTYGSTIKAAEPLIPITEDERAALVSGVVMGIDMANAQHGQPPMSKDSWVKFALIFEEATRGCTDIRCVTDKIVKLRDEVLQRRSGQSPNQSPQHSPQGPEILR